MSTAIPAWLGHLRTDRRGIPVPHINLWGPEDPARYSIEHDPAVGGLAIFLRDDDQTVPDFTRQNMHRQRQCMVEGLCQVCARPVPWSRRFLVISSISAGDPVHVEGLGRVVTVTEPWLDQRCASYALSHCPALLRRRRVTQPRDLYVIRVTSKRDVVLVVSRGWVEGPLEAESRRIQPYMWAKLHLPALQIETHSTAEARHG